MAKQMQMRLLCSWTEVAPALLISHNKTSTCPELETITEAWELEAEEKDLQDYKNKIDTMDVRYFSTPPYAGDQHINNHVEPKRLILYEGPTGPTSLPSAKGIHPSGGSTGYSLALIPC
ncbi:unnamed protein product [Malus baccata var. baccata]